MAAPTKAVRVLIVDDEDDHRRVLAELLRLNGFECAEAPDGKAALSLLNAGSFDLGIFDIAMPGLSGRELASIAQAVSPDMRLIAVTVLDAAPELTDFGFEAAVQKPFKAERLVRLCRHFADP